MLKHPSWTPEAIAQLSSAQVVVLRDNALKNHAENLVAWCETELSKRNESAPRSRKSRNGPLSIRADEISAELAQFAEEVSAKYDLSKRTASRLTGWGFRGFRPHSLLAKNGKAKTGGLRKQGLCDLDTYVSYRVKNVVISLGAWLAKGRPIEEIEFQLFAPEEWLDDPLTYDQLRPGIPMPAKGIDHGQRFQNLDDAKEAMRRILEFMDLPKIAE